MALFAGFRALAPDAGETVLYVLYLVVYCSLFLFGVTWWSGG